MIAREGYGMIGLATALAIALVVAAFWIPAPWHLLAYLLAALAICFTLYFFRDPHRVPHDAIDTTRAILAPADGKVVLVEHGVDEPLYLEGPAQQISIFLSPLNVHVNRIPADGVIEYDEYVPGDYLVAWHPKASEHNERSQLGLLHPSGRKIVFKQIAGAVARRIVYHVTVGDEVKAGERFGIVKFGSRMDVLFPPDVEVNVIVGDRVRAGQTVLAMMRDDVGAGEVPAQEEDERVV